MNENNVSENKVKVWFKNLGQNLLSFYKKHKEWVIAWTIIVVVLFTMIAIATRWFSNPATLSDHVSGGTDSDGNKYYHYNPTAFSIGISVQWYALFIMFGIISAVLLSRIEFKKRGIDPSVILDGLLICLPVAIIGARLYFVFDNWHLGWDFLKIVGWTDNGFQLSGLAIHGAVISVVLVLIPFCKWKKINYLVLLDIVLPAFLVGQAIGRWGNFMNHELYGPAINNEAYINFLPNFMVEQLTIRPEEARIGLQTGPRHPVFFYEFLLNFAGFIAICVLRRKNIFKIGDLACIYLIWYGVVRGGVTEPLRYFGGSKSDSMLMYFGDNEFPINVFLSIIMIVAGIALIVGRRFIFKNAPQPFYNEYFGKKKMKKIKKVLNDEVIRDDNEENNDQDNSV